MAFNIVWNEINGRFSKNQNALIINVGPTGSGKSYAAIRTYEEVCRHRRLTPTIENIAIGDGKQFLEIVSSGPPPRSLVVFDEAGVGLPAREFHSIINKSIDYVLETFRRDQIGVIFTVPDFSFLDIKARKLMHYYCELIDPNMWGLDFGHAKFLKVLNTPRGDKGIRFMYPSVFLRGVRYSCRPTMYGQGNVIFKHPENQQLIAEYEVRKKTFVDGLKEQAIAELRKAQRRYVSTRIITTFLVEQPERFGLGYIRLREGLPTIKSLNYVKSYIRGQFDSDEELMKKNFLLTKDILEQAIALALAEVPPDRLEALTLRTRGMSPGEIAAEMGRHPGQVSRLLHDGY